MGFLLGWFVAALVLFVLKSAKLCFWPKCPGDGAVQYLMEYQNMAAGMAAYPSTTAATTATAAIGSPLPIAPFLMLLPHLFLLLQLIDCWFHNKGFLSLLPPPLVYCCFLSHNKICLLLSLSNACCPIADASATAVATERLIDCCNY